MGAAFFAGTRRLTTAFVLLVLTSGSLIAQRTTRPRPLTGTSVPAHPGRAANDQLAAYLAGSLGMTSLSLWNGVITPDYPHKNTYGKQPVYVDWTRTNLDWWMQWTTTTPAASALWQVSTLPFPQGLGTNWTRPLGIRASGKVPNVPPPGIARSFSIDLSKLAPRPTWWTTLSASPSAASGSSVRQPLVTPPQSAAPSSARLRQPSNRSLPSQGGGNPASGAASTDVVLPAALYIRVVTLDGKGNPLSASNTAMLTFGPPKPPTPPVTLGAAAFGMPNVRIIKWVPPQPYAHDVQCWLMATRDIKWMGQTMWAKGQKANVCARKDDDDFFEDLGDAIGGSLESFVAIAEDAVDWMASVYNNLKEEAINTIVSGLKATVGCGSECQFALKTAVDAGLAAMGVPPSIPNSDQLVAQLEQQGVEYLAGAMVSAAASQGVPVPQELAEHAVEEFVEKAKQAASSSSGSDAPLFVPDPDRTYRPAVLVVELRNTGGTPTRPTALAIQQKSRTHYADMVFHAPSLEKGATMRVPLFLTPMDDPEAWRQALESTKGTIVNAGAVSKHISRRKR